MQRIIIAASVAAAAGYNAAMPPRTVVRAVRSLSKLSGGARAASPVMDITLEEAGEFGTTDYTMTFMKDGKAISPWHDVPLEAGNGMYNMLTEIPKMTLKKMEVRSVLTLAVCTRVGATLSHNSAAAAARQPVLGYAQSRCSLPRLGSA